MMRLSDLKVGEKGKVSRISNPPGPKKLEDISVPLVEMGLVEGSEIEIVHQAPFGGDPIAVRVRGALLALRRAEAEFVEVERTSP